MFTLKNIKSEKTITTHFESNLKEVLQVINSNKVGCVVLLDGDVARGIISESDIIHSLEQKISLDQKAISIANKNIITTEENRPVDFAFDLLTRHNIKRIILQDQAGKYQGIVLQEDLVQHLESNAYKVDLQIKTIIDPKRKIISIDKHATLQETLSLMYQNKVGAIIITKNGNHVGIVTEKDIIEAVYNNTDTSESVHLFMTSPLISISQETPVQETVEIMQAHGIRRILVKNEKEQIISILTNRDILQYVKGNYTTVLQNRIKQAQEIMNLFPEPIMEIYSTKNNTLISWINTIAKDTFGDTIVDKEITTLIANQDWEKIKKEIEVSNTIPKITLTIQMQTYEVSGRVSDNIASKYIKLIFKNVTNYENKNKQLQEVIEKEIDKRLESEYLLMQQAKLATMGEMIGHIAHQWRQPLAKLGGIFMNIESAYSFDELTKEYLKNKLTAGNKLIKYMSTTIDDFRNFFEPATKEEVFNINEQIQNALNLLQASLIYRHIKIDFQSTKELFTIGYPSEFSQAVLNIIANAEDALVAREIENGVIVISLEEDEEFNIIKIKDNAGGIDKENLPQIFNSHFTTKHRKEGSGLGLYMSKLIIETKLKGKINAQNDKDGAIFTISLRKST